MSCSVQWNRKRVALTFMVLFVVGISISSTMAFPLFNVSTTESKRFGMWLQYLSELHHEEPYEFYQTYFLTPPYFSALEIIFPVWHQQYDNFVSWMDAVATYADNHPTVQIYVMLALDMDSTDHWNRVENCLQHWDDNPSIYSVGVNCEHSKLHFPNSFDHDGFERFQTLSSAYGKQFICYYFQNAPETRTKSDFQWIAHVNWPYLGHRRTLYSTFDPDAQQVGISAGLYDFNPQGYPDPDEPSSSETYKETTRVGWNRATIRYMLEIGYSHDDGSRNCLIFSELGLWDHTEFREDVWELQQGYEVYLATSTTVPIPDPDFDSSTDHPIKLLEYGATDPILLKGESTTIWYTAEHVDDKSPFDGSRGVLYLNGSAMNWSDVNNRWEYTVSYDTAGTRKFKVSLAMDQEHAALPIKRSQYVITIQWVTVKYTQILPTEGTIL
ncbi:MAG: hypothetical protein JSV76_00515 [Candidatus Bathyarchaeota archaeon]|nr:MAG: hypothetical protein JSV76_00515 [Candidatus Bathyarchaeota archaeon]